jgi:hypothetical protein
VDCTSTEITGSYTDMSSMNLDADYGKIVYLSSNTHGCDICKVAVDRINNVPSDETYLSGFDVIPGSASCHTCLSTHLGA